VAKALTIHGPAAPAMFICSVELHLFNSFLGQVFMAQMKQVNILTRVAQRKQPVFQGAELQQY